MSSQVNAKDYEAELTGGPEDMLLGLRNIGVEISNRIEGYLTEPFSQLWNDWNKTIQAAREDPFETIAGIVLPFPIPPRSFTKVPEFIIDLALNLLEVFVVARLAKKYKRFKTVYSILTGGIFKTSFKAMIQQFGTFLWNKSIDISVRIMNGWQSIKIKFGNFIKNAMSSIAKGIGKVFKAIVRKFTKGAMKKVLAKFAIKAAALLIKLALTVIGAVAALIALAAVTTLIAVTLGSIPAFAKGGFPSKGRPFIAREAGPELVGKMGSRSAVVNNDQIVESVSSGVYEAFRSYFGNSNSSGPAVAKVYLDGKCIAMASA